MVARIFERTMNHRRTLNVLALASVLLAAAPAAAETPSGEPGRAPVTPARVSAFHVDAEIDPTAYVLSGYSLHLGLGYERLRLDLGAYAMKLPKFAHADDGFDVSFDGFGAKLQYFFLAEQRGLFAGVDGGVMRVLAQRQGTDLARRNHQVGAGVHAGWRIAIHEGLYVTPWIGVGYSFGARDVTLAGSTFQPNPVTVFPAVHIGYRFQ